MRGTARHLLVTWPAALALLAAGCSGVGDFCHSDDDCVRGLRCTAAGGSRGVCTYPGGTPDQALGVDQKQPDEGVGDTTPVDSSPDRSADAVTPDAATPDSAAPDTRNPDTRDPDAVTPDADLPDASSPDAAPPDAASQG